MTMLIEKEIGERLAKILSEYSEATGYCPPYGGWEDVNFGDEFMALVRGTNLDPTKPGFDGDEFYNKKDNIARRVAEKKIADLAKYAAEMKVPFSSHMAIALLDPVASTSEWHASSYRC